MSRRDFRQLSDETIREWRRLRWMCRTNLEFLCQNILGFKNVESSIHGPILNILQKFPYPENEDQAEEYDYFDKRRGVWKYKPLKHMLQLQGKRRKLILDPRSHLKTTINAEAHSIQWVLNYPDIAILIVQSNLDKAADIIGEMKKIFIHNTRFREVFPEYVPWKKLNDWGTKEEFTVECRGKEITRKESTFMAGSIDKGTAGYHFDVMKFSDIVEPANVKTRAMIESVRANFQMQHNLLVSPEYWIDVEGTRYVEGDTYGKIIDNWTRQKALGLEPRYDIHVRGCWIKKFAKETPGFEEHGHAVVQYTPDKLREDNFIGPDKHEIPIWEKDNEGITRFTYEALMEEKRDDPYIFSCTPGYAKILMSDLEEKPIEHVQIGEEVIGYFFNNCRPRLEKAKVLAIGNHKQKVFRYHLDDGTYVDCTEDHKWWGGSRQCKPERKPYRIPKLGRTLFRHYKQDFSDKNEAWSYLAGIIDGKGHIPYKENNTGSITISQSKKENPEVFNKIKQTLDKLQIKYSIYEEKGDRQGKQLFVIKSPKDILINFANKMNFGKKEQLRLFYWKYRKRIGRPVKIIKIEYLGKMPVYWLETTTGNYISQGVLSKNCQKDNCPIGGRDGKVIFVVRKGYRPRFITPELFRRVRIIDTQITVDTAETKAEGSNYTAIVIGSWDRNGRLYVRNIIHDKFSPLETCQRIVGAGMIYKPSVVKIEETSFVRGLKPSLEREMVLQGIDLNLDFLKRDNQVAKEERIENTLEPWYTKGDLIFLSSIKKEILLHLLKELEGFPRAETDDILDALSDFWQNQDQIGRPKPEKIVLREEQYLIERHLGIENPWDPLNSYHVIENPGFNPYYNSTGGL